MRIEEKREKKGKEQKKKDCQRQTRDPLVVHTAQE